MNYKLHTIDYVAEGTTHAVYDATEDTDIGEGLGTLYY